LKFDSTILFVWLIIHQPTVLFTEQINHQQPANTIFLSQQTPANSSQPNEQENGYA
jgi:hypothetical protein